MLVDVYVAYTNNLDELRFNGIFECLKKSRQEKITRMKRSQDKKLSLMAGYLIKKVIEDKGLPYDDVEFCTNEHGKPEVAGSHENELFFNVAHSKDIVTCVVCDRPIGCDVEYSHVELDELSEKELRVKRDMAEQFLMPKEYEKLMACTNANEFVNLFYRYWTLKESFVKANGMGMYIPFTDFSVEMVDDTVSVVQSIDFREYSFKEFALDSNYHFACCVQNANEIDIRYHKVW